LYIHGGSTAPIALATGIPGSERNRLRMVSFDDVIQGAYYSVIGIGGQRFLGPSVAGPTSNSRLDLELHRTRMSSLAGDLQLMGAVAYGDGTFPAGDGNVLHALILDVVGSGGPIDNFYADDGNDVPGIDNRLEIVGSPASFAVSNQSINPAPPASAFTGN
jgi:hypothetical protein